MARGADRRAIFRDEHDYQTYMRLLAATAMHFRWHLYAFCLMPNHIHLLLETTEPNLGKSMQWLQKTYSRAFNMRHARIGHLYEARYRAPLPIVDESQFIRTVGYVTTNASRASLCATAADWPWGSHSLVTAGHVPRWLAHELLLARIEAITGVACYDRLVETYERDPY